MRRLVCSALVMFCLAIEASGQVRGWSRSGGGSPQYWEFAGDDPRQAGFIMIRAVAFTVPTTRPGDRVALVGFFLPVMRDDGPSFPPVLTELRFVGSDAAGLSLETREGEGGPAFEKCLAGWLSDSVTTINPRERAFSICINAPGPRWGPWRTLRYPFGATHVMRLMNAPSSMPELPLSLAVMAGELRVAVVP